MINKFNFNNNNKILYVKHQIDQIHIPIHYQIIYQIIHQVIQKLIQNQQEFHLHNFNKDNNKKKKKINKVIVINHYLINKDILIEKKVLKQVLKLVY